MTEDGLFGIARNVSVVDRLKFPLPVSPKTIINLIAVIYPTDMSATEQTASGFIATVLQAFV